MKEYFRLKALTFLALTLTIGVFSFRSRLSYVQAVSLTIFLASVLGTVLFWRFKLAVAFAGIAFLIVTKAIDIESLISFAALDVILFLVAMMIIMGLLREVNFFTWLLSKVLVIRNITGRKLFIIVAVTSAMLACVIDEVTSIIFMIAFVIALCDFFEIRPIPLIITSVMATNVGSSGTVLGNPIGILIATKAGLTFEDFLVWAFPLTILASLITIILIMLIYRKEIKLIDIKLGDYRKDMRDFRKLLRVPMTKDVFRELLIFCITLISIALHHRLEEFFGFAPNGLLLAIPLLSAAGIMIWKRDSARAYVERDVDWWALIFYMLLFAKAGTLKFTGLTDILAGYLYRIAGTNNLLLITMVSWCSFIGSSVLDNVVLVSAFIPVIHSFEEIGLVTFPLWWALLFGGCIGGNLTIVGSAGNIVAVGFLEKKSNLSITFFEWFKVGSLVGTTSMAIVWILLLFISRFMPQYAL